MNSVFKMMNFVSNMMNFVFKMQVATPPSVLKARPTNPNNGSVSPNDGSISSRHVAAASDEPLSGSFRSGGAVGNRSPTGASENRSLGSVGSDADRTLSPMRHSPQPQVSTAEDGAAVDLELLGGALSHHQHAAHSQVKATEQWTSAAEQWDLAAQIKRDQRVSEAPRSRHTAPSPVPTSGRKSWEETQADALSASFAARRDDKATAQSGVTFTQICECSTDNDRYSTESSTDFIAVVELTSPQSPVPTPGRKRWAHGDTPSHADRPAPDAGRGTENHIVMDQHESGADTQAGVMSASFAARRDVATAKQPDNDTTAQATNSGSPSAARTIPGRSPVTRKHARGRRKPNQSASVSLSSGSVAKAAAALTTAPKVKRIFYQPSTAFLWSVL